jgi:hypothetical protein
MINNMEDLLSGGAAASGNGDSTNWHTAGLKEFLLLLPSAARMGSGVGLTSLSHAIGSILTVVHALSQSAIDAEVSPPPHLNALRKSRIMATHSSLPVGRLPAGKSLGTKRRKIHRVC